MCRFHPIAPLATLLITMFLSGCGSGGSNKTQGKTPTPEEELQNLVGKWRVISIETETEKVSGKDAEGQVMKITVDGKVTYEDELKDKRKPEPGVLTVESPPGNYTVTVDPSKNPKEINIRNQRVSGRGEKLDSTDLGIYKLEGDKLTICIVQGNTPRGPDKKLIQIHRPKDFKINPEADPAEITVYQRAK